MANNGRSLVEFHGVLWYQTAPKDHWRRNYQLTQLFTNPSWKNPWSLSRWFCSACGLFALDMGQGCWCHFSGGNHFYLKISWWIDHQPVVERSKCFFRVVLGSMANMFQTSKDWWWKRFNHGSNFSDISGDHLSVHFQLHLNKTLVVDLRHQFCESVDFPGDDHGNGGAN